MRHAESNVVSILADVLPLPDRMLLIRAFRFGVSRVIATDIHMAIATTLVNGASTTQVTVNSAIFVYANVCSYLLSALRSFSVKPAHANFPRFCAVLLFGLTLTLAILWYAQTLGLSYWIGLAGILSTVPPLIFMLHRFWTFRWRDCVFPINLRRRCRRRHAYGRNDTAYRYVHESTGATRKMSKHHHC